MINNQDGTLTDENALCSAPPLEYENEQLTLREDASTEVSEMSTEYALGKEDIIHNQITYSSSEDSCISSIAVALKKDKIFRNVLTDNSSQGSVSSNVNRNTSTVCSSQETNDTVLISDCDEGIDDVNMRRCQTVSDKSSLDDEINIRSLDTLSSQETQSSVANFHFNFRNRESFSSNSTDGKPSNGLGGNNNAKENYDDTKSETFVLHDQNLFLSKELENLKENTLLGELLPLNNKRPLVDDKWEGINQPEPKLIKYASIGPLQDFSKMYLKRTSSEGFQISKNL